MTTSVPDMEEASAERALRALVVRSGIASDACHLRLPEGGLPEPGQDKKLLERMGLAVDPEQRSASIVTGDLASAARLVRAGEPLLLSLPPTTEGNWLMLEGQEGELLVGTVFGPGDAEAQLRASAEELAARLGVAPRDALSWLALAHPVAAPAAPTKVGQDGSGHGKHISPLARLGELLRPDRGDLFSIALFAVAMGILLLAMPVAVQALVNFVAQGGAIPPLIVVSSLLFVGLAFAGVLGAIQAWLVELLQRRLFARTVADLAARLPRLAMEVHDRRNGPELVNRFFDVMTIQKAGSALLLDGLSLLLTVVVGLLLLAFYHPLLLAFDIILLGVIGLIVLGPMKRGVRSAIGESYAKYAVADWLEELARHPLLFRSGGVHSWIYKRSDRVVREYLERRGQHYRILFGQIVGALTLYAVASTALLGIGGLLVMQGSLTLGQLVAAELVVTMVVASVAKMGKQLENFYDLMAATDKVGYLLDLPLEQGGGEPYLVPDDAAGASLQLADVTAGPSGGPALFQGLSLDVPPGSTLGVCGASGSGKTVLLELLWGLRRPERGTVRFDGRDLKSISLEAARSSASFLAEIEVVGGSVRDNVRLGRTFVSDEDARRALRAVGILDAVERLPHGLETEISARGRPLSDGEVRCLQVARAIAGSPRLLIVSDPFLPLGGALRERLLDVLFDEGAHWTLVVASNAADVLQRCQRVLELPAGTMREPSQEQSQEPQPA